MAAVSLVIGFLAHPDNGWIEGTAIFIAVFLVSNISAGNDYTKQLQFKALEQSSAKDERTSVLREGVIERINPKDLVVGDILVLQVSRITSCLFHSFLNKHYLAHFCLHTSYSSFFPHNQAGDAIPADSIIFTQDFVLSNESSLTGEPDDLKKSVAKDCFLLSSCLVTEGEECRALVIGIGMHSQWGKIKANLVSEAVNTPLQDKLEDQGLLGIGDYVPPVAPLTLKEPAASEAKHGEVLSTPAAGVNMSSAARDASTSAGVDDMNKWTVAQYHSHSTLFFLRRNEVWIQLEGANPQVVKLQAIIKK